ncbi:cytochrome C [Skermanella stibiiresistens SB22]|uniref:Cytochrome c1 n=1 Tax=Skermanella stibiiresistens SB22 TaxID=1385369 RepID=W9HBC6_9PROT|nr:cytochrome c1 [Skermanella stibiiresistens]EWY41148.1 cytochrome C [Skermanella stibiiresistens SB22]
MRAFKTLILAAALGLGLTGSALAAESAVPPEQEWHHSGIFGTFDKAALQRGFQVYKEVCSTCHAMSLVSYRNLQALGFSEDEVKAIAAQYQVPAAPNDAGEIVERPAIPADHFKSPFPNEQAARAANGGAYPPDLSLMAKAREHGEDYLYALLTGFEEPPEGVTVPDGMYYNKYFPGHLIGMPPILQDDSVTYADNTPATLAQSAHDVSTFLVWAAEPHLETRKQTGVKVILFLLVFAGMMYAVKRKVWADAHP